MSYVRKETYAINELLDKVEMHHTKKDVALFDGDEIKLGSDRYKLFKQKGVVCVTCGLIGMFFAKERTYTKKPTKIVSWHMNLYAIDDNGKEVLMTKDHIVPKKHDGPDHIDNYQTMCQVCNGDKGSNI